MTRPPVPPSEPRAPAAVSRRCLAALCLAAALFGLAAGPASAQSRAARRAYKMVVFSPPLHHYGPNDPYAEAWRRIRERQSWNKRVEQRYFPPSALLDPAAVRQALEDLAGDPEIKAVVLGGAPKGSVEGCARLRSRRPDILIFALDPVEEPRRMSQAASLTLTLNHTARGFLLPTLAKRMEATALVYFSVPRHQEIAFLSRQYRVMSEAARDLDLPLLAAPDCPDPLTAGRAELVAYVQRTLADYRARYGDRLALYATDDALSEILVDYALKNGCLALDPAHPALFLGLPEALGLIKPTRDLFGQWRRLLTLEDERYLTLGASGQASTWVYPYPMTAILALTDLAVSALEKQVDFYDLNVISAALEKYSPGERWLVNVVMDYEKDALAPQLVVIMADSYWLGHGYQGFTRLNIPTKYYRLK